MGSDSRVGVKDEAAEFEGLDRDADAGTDPRDDRGARGGGAGRSAWNHEVRARGSEARRLPPLYERADADEPGTDDVRDAASARYRSRGAAAGSGGARWWGVYERRESTSDCSGSTCRGRARGESGGALVPRWRQPQVNLTRTNERWTMDSLGLIVVGDPFLVFAWRRSPIAVFREMLSFARTYDERFGGASR
jgi:hypothetical protein